MTDFFGPGSPYLSHPLLTNERTAAEVDRIVSWCSSPPVDVLDVGCGFGRHSIEFARRGHAVTGIDPSSALLDEARRRVANQSLDAGSIEFVHGGGADFVRPDAFDLAVCLFTTLGQRASRAHPSGAATILQNVRSSLRLGATFVLEVPERDRAIAALVEHEYLGPTEVTRSFDPQSAVLTERFVTPTGTYDLAYELFSRDELTELLETSGLRIVTTYDEALRPPPDTFMTLVAEPCPTG